MSQLIRIVGGLGLFAVVLITGCGKTDGRGESPVVQPIAAAQEPQPNPVAPKEETKNTAVAPNGSFNFLPDEGGKILGRILPPAPPLALAPLPSKTPGERMLPDYLARPSVTTIPATISPRPYPQPTLPAPRPTPLPDHVPTDLAMRDLERPEVIVLPVGALTRIDAPDLSKPVDLPILARPTPDRAPLEDPTIAFTARSIINDNPPLRVSLALFAKVNLPDPFEHVPAAKVKIMIPDDPAAALGNPPVPRP